MPGAGWKPALQHKKWEICAEDLFGQSNRQAIKRISNPSKTKVPNCCDRVNVI
jgi:hypothetical protein